MHLFGIRPQLSHGWSLQKQPEAVPVKTRFKLNSRIVDEQSQPNAKSGKWGGKNLSTI